MRTKGPVLRSHVHKRENWYLTVSVKELNSFIKKNESISFIVLQVLFFSCYIFTNNVYFTVVLKSEKMEKQYITYSVKDHKT